MLRWRRRQRWGEERGGQCRENDDDVDDDDDDDDDSDIHIFTREMMLHALCWRLGLGLNSKWWGDFSGDW